MGKNTLQRAFREALALAALGAAGCRCPDVFVVVPITEAQRPTNAYAGPDSRALTKEECTSLCGAPSEQCRLVQLCNTGTAAECAGGLDRVPDGGVAPLLAVQCQLQRVCIGGRRPEGFTSEENTSNTGEFLAQLAALEAASVPAFERLATELERQRAPEALVERARTAARDEVRHARAISKLAKKHGTTPKPFSFTPPRPRNLARMAEENAVEGCVRETFAALVALHQAEQANTPAVRRAFRAIASDEATHAQLAWDVHQWALEKLSPLERASVQLVMQNAVQTLKHECHTMTLSNDSALGLPSREQTLLMLDTLEKRLWNN